MRQSPAPLTNRTPPDLVKNTEQLVNMLKEAESVLAERVGLRQAPRGPRL